MLKLRQMCSSLGKTCWSCGLRAQIMANVLKFSANVLKFRPMGSSLRQMCSSLRQMCSSFGLWAQVFGKCAQVYGICAQIYGKCAHFIRSSAENRDFSFLLFTNNVTAWGDVFPIKVVSISYILAAYSSLSCHAAAFLVKLLLQIMICLFFSYFFS